MRKIIVLPMLLCLSCTQTNVQTPKPISAEEFLDRNPDIEFQATFIPPIDDWITKYPDVRYDEQGRLYYLIAASERKRVFKLTDATAIVDLKNHEHSIYISEKPHRAPETPYHHEYPVKIEIHCEGCD